MSGNRSDRQQLAQFRLAVIGPLLSAPPAHGAIGQAIDSLARGTYRHPLTGEPVQFSPSTLERWYYAARETKDPIGVLMNKVRCDFGKRRVVDDRLCAALKAQYEEHPQWSMKLHTDNLHALAEIEPERNIFVPSYATICRLMAEAGWLKRPKLKSDTEAAIAAQRRFESLEVRSYETTHVGALFHADFHRGSRLVLCSDGSYQPAYLFGAVDDHSRLGCHLQWYLSESAETHTHGLRQVFLKRGLPRKMMSDRGNAMRAAETRQGLADLGIEWDPTLAYSPYQNGKQENFWCQIEGRLLPMLDGISPLYLSFLNEATLAWLEFEYNRTRHQEIDAAPLSRFCAAPSVLRSSPDDSALVSAFRRVIDRKQRMSDGTVSLLGTRFEIPSAYRNFRKLWIRVAAWDLSFVHLVDETDQRKCIARLYPINKAENANGQRRTKAPLAMRRGEDAINKQPLPTELPPLLRKLMSMQRQSGLPSAYLKTDEE